MDHLPLIPCCCWSLGTLSVRFFFHRLLWSWTFSLTPKTVPLESQPRQTISIHSSLKRSSLRTGSQEKLLTPWSISWQILQASCYLDLFHLDKTSAELTFLFKLLSLKMIWLQTSSWVISSLASQFESTSLADPFPLSLLFSGMCSLRISYRRWFNSFFSWKSWTSQQSSFCCH